MAVTPEIAYFSMEIAVDSKIPTYSGGLGVLAGDTIRSAADLKVPLIAVSLLYRQGYFDQQLSSDGQQTELAVRWPIADLLERLKPEVEVLIEGRRVKVGAWCYSVTGVTGHVVPVIFLDADIAGNSDQDKNLTNCLYGGDQRYRLAQEALLADGGIRILRALGYTELRNFHMNEGHAALISLSLLEEAILRDGEDKALSDLTLKAIQARCSFTTHTPVAAGHDKFSEALAIEILGDSRWRLLRKYLPESSLNMTELALKFSHFVNGVSIKHSHVSNSMFRGANVEPITNGIHSRTWACPAFQALFDQYIPDWREYPSAFRMALRIPSGELNSAHQSAKSELLQFISKGFQTNLDPHHFTIGFARRSTAYKRALLVFHNIEWLTEIAQKVGPIQFVFAGKAHPHDHDGKLIIKRLHEFKDRLKDVIKIVYLPNYDMNMARLITSGVDLWLNTPRPPWEASGTSGMKAAVNGVPSLSVLDGWWVEGHIEGVTGWGVGEDEYSLDSDSWLQDERHSEIIYEKLSKEILPAWYHHRERYASMMRQTIALNASFFHTHRMVEQYAQRAYKA